jgi:mannose/cellobiose epimerase-like protein (N-acyl-D-glucosamine 2-epimerase family)
MIKRMLKTLLQPDGRGGFRDRRARALWTGYAWAHQLRPAVRRRTQGSSLPGAEAAIAGCTPDFFHNHVVEEILPFWLNHAVDRSHGGFNTHLDRHGRPREQTAKTTAKQARMIAAFVFGYRLSGRADFLDAARHGFDFLVAHLWDEEEDGWFSSVDRGGAPVNMAKNALHHMYALLGLAAFHGATGDLRALDFAQRTWAVIEGRMRDPRFDGYSLEWSRDWQVRKPQKDLGTLVNLVKACLGMADATGDEVYPDRAAGVLRLIQERLFDSRSGLVLEYWHRDWRYFPTPVRDRIDVGHVLEAGWLMIALGRRSGDCAQRDWGLRLIDRLIEAGWDRRHGGFHHRIFRNGMADGGAKLWWTQCEAISALAHAWSASWDVTYLRYLAALRDFCWRHFVDAEHGEWFVSCTADGRPLDINKGNEWKGAYHQVEAACNAALLLRPHDADRSCAADDRAVS